jgi:hypothetical protein
MRERGGRAATTSSARSARDGRRTAAWRTTAASATSCACTAPAVRRAEGDSRDPRRRRRPDADRDLAALQRTPGSTKDYLSWLEDVDLVAPQKRYSYPDPLLRVWVRLHCRAIAPTRRPRARGASVCAAAAAAQAAEASARAWPPPGCAADEDRKAWGIIEID